MTVLLYLIYRAPTVSWELEARAQVAMQRRELLAAYTAHTHTQSMLKISKNTSDPYIIMTPPGMGGGWDPAGLRGHGKEGNEGGRALGGLRVPLSLS